MALAPTNDCDVLFENAKVFARAQDETNDLAHIDYDALTDHGRTQKAYVMD